MTTLELAENIARRVVMDIWGEELVNPDLAMSVLDELRQHGAWFCRIQTEDTPDGLLDVGSTPYEQQELFR